MRRIIVFCAVAGLLGPAGAHGFPVAAAPAADEQAVTAVIRAFEEAWNRHDMDSFANLFLDDADFVNVLGSRWIGGLRSGRRMPQPTLRFSSTAGCT
jgi:hypothetical protein